MRWSVGYVLGIACNMSIGIPTAITQFFHFPIETFSFILFVSSIAAKETASDALSSAFPLSLRAAVWKESKMI